MQSELSAALPWSWPTSGPPTHDHDEVPAGHPSLLEGMPHRYPIFSASAGHAPLLPSHWACQHSHAGPKHDIAWPFSELPPLMVQLLLNQQPPPLLRWGPNKVWQVLSQFLQCLAVDFFASPLLL